ncbi:MAG: MGMT family protein [Chitinophagales bacterium]|nr:MGMT family protein [Chitinophagales bacterium]MCZ2394689.1 MGMT family protein [Chitinophagales bacterium]
MNQNFFERVYDVARQIPQGRVTTYGMIAHYLGTKGSARMVGWAMNASGKDESIPAHRVVNRNGLLTGKAHFGDIYQMEQLLFEEGIQVKDNQIQNFKNLIWDPSIELISTKF